MKLRTARKVLSSRRARKGTRQRAERRFGRERDKNIDRLTRWLAAGLLAMGEGH